MDKLLEFVITHGTLNLGALSDMLSCLDDEMVHRFVMAVFGIEDYHLPEDFPKEVIDKGVVKTFTGYNYLEDRVKCTYKVQITRWYPNEEKSQNGSYDYKSSKCEGYEYESVRTEPRHDSFSLQGWMTLANSQKNN